MKIFSEDRKSFIEIEFIESEKERMPSIKVSVTTQNEGFGGVLNSTWIEIDELNNFLLCMEEIDTKRRGRAHLCSMSPNEFLLDFEVFDKSGHIKVSYLIAKYISHPFFREISLHGEFDIDSSEFSSIVESFRTLIKE
ncbi:hypothetical protein [Clostridium sp.]|uniref:WapI family immunity protein n=1 Tax=Clostridium sp. TaxID=1506 RepID=UPI00262690B4|nr:hypothetical protein [Clostridium sp.]